LVVLGVVVANRSGDHPPGLEAWVNFAARLPPRLNILCIASNTRRTA